jgi:Acetyltransferase (GNAT) domain
MTNPQTITDNQRATRFHCHQLDPTKDPRWAEFVNRHPRASVFHTVGWLQALHRTYDYEPVAFTTSPATGDLENGVIFCRINSWLTGRRLVSLPFSDHCEALCDSPEDLNFLMRYLKTTFEHDDWKYMEIRPITGHFRRMGDGDGLFPTAEFFLHRLDLTPSQEAIFESLDRDSVQRRIRRAERAGLVEKCGRSEDLLNDFYNLFVTTRARHQLPPIPLQWFRNLIESQKDALEIRIASKETTPIAGILTLRFRENAYYKYGCSDARFNNFGAMPWLLWNAILAAKKSGAREFDMGRTERDNEGLLTFKNHWVSQPERLVYWRYPETPIALASENDWKLKIAKRAFSHMPSGLLTVAGKLLYRHIG